MSENSKLGKCETCHSLTAGKCSACQNVFYCCKEHQKSDWKTHKKICKAYKISSDKILGRHLLASRDISPNQLVLKEAPLIWGPTQETAPVCLGCCKEIDEHNSRPCSKCGWPVCKGGFCETSLVHRPECEYTVRSGQKVSIKNFGVTHPLYQCITVLRCLYLKQNHPEKWQKLTVLQSHDNERQNTAKYENEKNSVVQLILKFFKLSNIFSQDEVLQICGILMVNSHEVPLSDPPYIAIYDVASLLEHDCRAACSKSFTSRGEILISSGKHIMTGEHLSICYADPLWGTQNRRSFLNETKFFWCNCQRCTDSTEFESFFNAIKCTKRKCNGYLLPKNFLQTAEANVDEQTWDCSQCTNKISGGETEIILQRIEQEFSYFEEDKSVDCYRKLIDNFEKVLHANHYVLTEIKFNLCQKIGQFGLKNVADRDLEFKASLCLSLDSLTKNIIPAEKRVRGLILFELHAALAGLGRRKSVSESNPEVFSAALKDSKKVVEQAIDLLKFEPEVLPEGKIFKQALINVRDIDAILSKIPC